MLSSYTERLRRALTDRSNGGPEITGEFCAHTIRKHYHCALQTAQDAIRGLVRDGVIKKAGLEPYEGVGRGVRWYVLNTVAWEDRDESKIDFEFRCTKLAEEIKKLAEEVQSLARTVPHSGVIVKTRIDEFSDREVVTEVLRRFGPKDGDCDVDNN